MSTEGKHTLSRRRFIRASLGAAGAVALGGAGHREQDDAALAGRNQ
jgi:nitrous oxide reductase